MKYESGRINFEEQPNELVGVSRSIGYMDADLFLDVVWRRRQRLSEEIAGFGYHDRRNFVEHKKRLVEIETMYLAVEQLLLWEMLPTILNDGSANH